MKNKNIKLLKDFNKYCIARPSQRFWQALRNWANVDAICVQNGIETLDTFYFEKKDK